MSLFKSLTDLVSDGVAIVTAPIEMVADLTGAIVKPVADAARAAVDEVKSLKD